MQFTEIKGEGMIAGYYEPGEQRFHGSAKFKFYCYIPRPLEAIGRCLEQN